MRNGYRPVRARRIGGHLTFTEGEDLFYELMMQSVPRFGAIPLTPKERDCEYCLYWDEKKKRCGENTCTVFDN